MKKEHKIFPSKFKDKTLALFRALDRTVSYADISKATGLSEQWLGMFFRDQIPRPDVGKVETLFNYLSPTQFDI